MWYLLKECGRLRIRRRSSLTAHSSALIGERNPGGFSCADTPGTPTRATNACLGCRKVYRQRPDSDLTEQQTAKRSYSYPQCGEPMKNMGKDSKAPAHREMKQWQKVNLDIVTVSPTRPAGALGLGRVGQVARGLRAGEIRLQRTGLLLRSHNQP